MKNVIIIGASGNIAKLVTEILVKKNDINLTLLVRSKKRLKRDDTSKCRIIEANVMDYNKLNESITGQDIVYVNLAGDLEAMSRNIVKAMQESVVKRIIAISSIGIYEAPLRSVLIPYRRLADTIESSNLDYTIIRPQWFTDEDEVDFELTRKGEAEKGSVISQKSLATFVAQVIELPEKYVCENLSINKPNS
jgi:uncharacterized protein YbjT (DUF2867 family)